MLSSISKNCWYELVSLLGGNKLCLRMVLKGILALTATATLYVFYTTFQSMKLINSKIKEKYKEAATQTTGLNLLGKDQQST